MGVVNLGVKYAKQIQQRFTVGSLLQGRLENDVEFVGARTVRVHTIVPVEVNDYDRTATANRYGVPQEVGDTVQELTMGQDKSFTGIIDKGNSKDQAINKAGKFLKVQMDERIIPLKDKYGLQVLANGAGVIAGSAEAISKANVCERISTGTVALDNAEVPADGRTLFLTAECYKQLRLSEEFLGVEALGHKSLAKGQVGEYDNMAVIKVPASRMPAGVNFLIVHKSAACSPAKISDTKMHTDPPGISGSLVEGRFYWDTFVFGAKAAGIYADVDTGAVPVLAAPTVTAAGAVTLAEGCTGRYTLDGTDPRYSATAVEITASATGLGAKGDTLRACQYKEGTFPSPVAGAVRA